jgi:hypothetical protein
MQIPQIPANDIPRDNNPVRKKGDQHLGAGPTTLHTRPECIICYSVARITPSGWHHLSNNDGRNKKYSDLITNIIVAK